MNKVTKKTGKNILFALLLILVLAFAGCSSDEPATNTDSGKNNTPGGNNSNTATIDYGLADNIQDGTILQVWCWDFETIKENMSTLAYAGFTSIQTVPINACIGEADKMQLGGSGMWYNHYQATDWKIGNYQVGTRDEFIEMCKEADKYGIKVIVDVAPNHTSSPALVSDDLKNAAGGEDKLYHPNGFNKITNYGDRLQSTSMAMGGLADVDTENKGFQDYFIAYMNDCIACGADGFRIDTAKHIALPDDPKATDAENNFYPRLTTEVTNADEIFMYGEVLQGDNERLGAYTEMLDGACASAYGAQIRGCVMSGKLRMYSLLDYSVDASVSPSKLVTWVESHDNYINDSTFAGFANEDIVLGWAIIAAREGGTPLYYNRPVGADKKDKFGPQNLVGPTGDDAILDPIVIATNRFRNAMVGEKENFFAADEDNNVAVIERGTKGAVIVNLGKADETLEITTALADGSYTDRVDNTTVYEVKGGKLNVTLPARSVIVLYNDGYIEVPEMVKVDIEGLDYAVYNTQTEFTLSIKNAASAYYVIDDGEKVDCKDGDKVTLTGTVGEKSHIKIYTESESGEKFVEAFYYDYKEALVPGDKIQYVKPNNWAGDNAYAYIYTKDADGNVVESSPWPGDKMTVEGNLCTYELKDTYLEAYVVFNDGGENQIPKKGKEGYPVVKDKKY